MLLMTAISAAITGIICCKKNISFYLLILSNILQIVGTGALSTLPTSIDLPTWTYGLEIILGAAFGMGLVCLMIITRVEVSHEDNAVAMGAITQVRVLGGIIGLAIVQAVLISSLHTWLAPVLTPTELISIFSSTYNIPFLPAAAAAATRVAYGNAMNIQMRIACGFAGASLLAGLLAWRKEIITFDNIVNGKGPASLRATKETAGGITVRNEEENGDGARQNDAHNGDDKETQAAGV
jgi:hypothetical protein